MAVLLNNILEGAQSMRQSVLSTSEMDLRETYFLTDVVNVEELNRSGHEAAA